MMRDSASCFTMNTHMPYVEYAPDPRLTEVVECFWSLCQSGPRQQSSSRWVLPDGCMDIVFALRKTSQSTSWKLDLVGPMTVAKSVRMSRQPITFGVRFRPGGATSLLGIPACQTRDRSIPLADIAGSKASELLDQLATAADVRSQLSFLENFVEQRIKTSCSMDPALAAILKQLVAGTPSVNLSAIAARKDFGTRRLRRAFDKWVGLSPALFRRVARFRRLVASMDQSPYCAWADRALATGYYDQAHMNRDFQDFVGMPPSVFAAIAN
jgi:AraC-like DNA-binding protein